MLIIEILKKVKKIAILLATYNSELYLKILIESIKNQSYRDWILYIRDDGSTDNTLQIISSYCLENPSNFVFLDDSQKNIGPKDSFMWILSHVNSDYYMFCDHDDYWLPNKIEKSINRMLSIEKLQMDLPIIVHSDLYVTDSDLKIIHPSFWAFSRISPTYSSSFYFHCAYNNVTGCTMLINRKARDLSLKIPSTAKMHDSWIALVVSFNKGVINYIEEPLTYYRQHSANTIGAKKSRNMFQKMVNAKIILKQNMLLYKTIKVLFRMNIIHFFLNKIKYCILLKVRFAKNY